MNTLIPRFRGSLASAARTLLAVAGFCVLATLSLAADAGKRFFDVPAGQAEMTLRRFGEQAGGQFVFSADKVAGVRTKLVRGDYTAREALERMVEGTELRAIQDEQTGALTVDRIASAPNANRRPNAAAAENDLVELSAFEVKSSREFGYRAASSVTATGIGTEIANIPVNVGVVTNEFIQDWGGVELREATKGVSGFNSDTQNSNRVWLRGFESSRILQDGFEIGVGMMTDGVDRVEVIKGPSAIFHGEVNPAGVVNLISSKPTWRPQHHLRLSAGSFEHLRTSFQTSGPIVDRKLAYMAFGSYTDENGWADHMMRRISMYGGALTWQPLPNLKFTVDGRRVRKTRIESTLLPLSHPAFVAAVQAGQVAPLTTARAWLNANPLYGANEPQSRILVDHLVFKSKEHNPFNNDYPQTENRRTIQAEMTYQHGKTANFRLAAFDNASDRTSGFFTSFRPVAGYNRDLIFAAAEHRYNYGFSDQERSGFKSDLNLNFDTFGIRHALLVGFEHYERSSGASNINTTARVYNPRTEPERNAMAELRTAVPNWFPRIADYGRLESDGYYIANQMSLFDGKLRFLTGARRMDLEVYSPGATAGAGRTNKQSKTTPQAGVLFRPWEFGAFYANYSETFESQLVVDALGGVSGPITGDGLEAGFKTDWLDGRLSGTIGFYRIERSNIARRDTVRERELNITPLWIMGGAQRTEGMDVDITYTPVRNLQFVLAYANMWFAKTVADQQVPQQVGVRLRHSPEHALGLFGKYTFLNGPLKGFYVGASGLYRSAFNFHDSWDVPYQITNFRSLDLLAGYRLPIKDGRQLGFVLNVNNVTNNRYLDLQYLWNEPVNWRLSVDYRF